MKVNVSYKFLITNKTKILSILVCFVSLLSFFYYQSKGYLLAYNDAESHLLISKFVTSGLQSGFAQLGGVWLPLHHLLLVPFSYFDFLLYNGFSGYIVSGLSFVLSILFIYKSVYFLTKSSMASLVSVLVFIINPNILYMQSVAMTESLFIFFLCANFYYFSKFLRNKKTVDVFLSSLFVFFAAFTRYDGWFLVFYESFLLTILGLFDYFTNKKIPSLKVLKIKWLNVVFNTSVFYKNSFLSRISGVFDYVQGYVLTFAYSGIFAIAIWLVWDYLIFGDPLYFTNSEYSASSQQRYLHSISQLPSYHNFLSSLLYFVNTSALNVGLLFFILSIFGMILFFKNNIHDFKSILIGLSLLSVFLFNVLSLYLGQSVIYVPNLTPDTHTNTIFNVRYGLLMLPFVVVFIGYLFSRLDSFFRFLLIIIVFLQLHHFYFENILPIVIKDGLYGMSASYNDPVEDWLADNYDGGLVLTDLYARRFSVLNSGVPIASLVYVGSKPYWTEALKKPNKIANYIIIGKDDYLYKHFINDEINYSILTKYYYKLYEYNDVIIYKKL